MADFVTYIAAVPPEIPQIEPHSMKLPSVPELLAEMTSENPETTPAHTIKWFSSSSQNDSSRASNNAISNNIIQGALDFAKSKLGGEYVYGNAGEGDTYDCSGLIYAAYKSQGKTVPRSTDAWIASSKSTVTPTEGKPGDVIITYSNNGKSGKHARLITKNLGNGKYECIEAKGKKDGIVASTYTVNNRLINIYRAKKGLKLIKRNGFK